jgi:hypothetical protein
VFEQNLLVANGDGDGSGWKRERTTRWIAAEHRSPIQFHYRDLLASFSFSSFYSSSSACMCKVNENFEIVKKLDVDINRQL